MDGGFKAVSHTELPLCVSFLPDSLKTISRGEKSFTRSQNSSMALQRLLFLSIPFLLLVSLSSEKALSAAEPAHHVPSLSRSSFPPGFIFGTASSSYQVSSGFWRFFSGVFSFGFLVPSIMWCFCWFNVIFLSFSVWRRCKGGWESTVYLGYLHAQIPRSLSVLLSVVIRSNWWLWTSGNAACWFRYNDVPLFSHAMYECYIFVWVRNCSDNVYSSILYSTAESSKV